MKKGVISIFGGILLTFSMPSLYAQQTEKSKTNLVSGKEDEQPLMYKFEPNFLTAIEVRQEEIKKARAVIDTMQISDRKRRRLLRDLHKNIGAIPTKTSVAETEFEDD